MGRYKDICDDEIRIISASQEKKGFRPWVWVCLATSGVAIILALLFLFIMHLTWFIDIMYGFMVSSNNGELLKEKDWRVVFDAFSSVHGSKKSKTPVEYTSIDKLPIRNLYYNQKFSYEELDDIIEAITLSDSLDEKTAKKLVKKIKEELGTIYYEEKASAVSKIEPEKIVDNDYYRKNIKTIENAIENGVRVTFYYNGIDSEGKLERQSLSKEIISPYYLVANNGKFYVVACKDSFMGKNYKKVMSLWRVDLMTEVRIYSDPASKENEKITNKKDA